MLLLRKGGINLQKKKKAPVKFGICSPIELNDE